MNAKKCFLITIVVSGVFLTIAASFWPEQRSESEHRRMALTGAKGKFGPLIDTILPSAENEQPLEILDLETGKALLLAPFDPESRADEIVAWIRSNGLDVSSCVWPNGAACITYDMTIIAVDRKCWDETTADELRDHPALAPERHSPRRLLVLGSNKADTYMFRTGDGTLGMLRILGLSDNKQGVRVCYKLINPGQSLALASDSQNSDVRVKSNADQ